MKNIQSFSLVLLMCSNVIGIPVNQDKQTKHVKNNTPCLKKNEQFITRKNANNSERDQLTIKLALIGALVTIITAHLTGQLFFADNFHAFIMRLIPLRE